MGFRNTFIDEMKLWLDFDVESAYKLLCSKRAMWKYSYLLIPREWGK